MSKLVTYKLGDICNVTDYVANGSFAALNENVEYLDTKDYAVMIRLVDYNSNWKSSLLYTTKKSYEFLKKSSLKPGDVVIANVGANAGTIFRVPNLGMPMTLAPNAVACFPKELNILDREFLYYYFLSSNGQWSISTILGGSAQPKFNKTDFRSLELSLPAIDEQKAIANILGTLDEKIELNKRTNETLEGIAKSLFQSWFIDFDPVKAKSENQSTGLPDEISDLFPDSFEDSELGQVPLGWECGKLGNYVSIKRGGSPRPIKDFIVANGIPWVKISDATASKNRFIFSTKEFIKSEGLSKTVFLKEGSIILSNSATPGLPKFLELDACIHDGWLHFPEKEKFSDLYLYQLFLSIRSKLCLLGNGSVFTNLKTDILKNYNVIIPSKECLDLFDMQVDTLHQRCKSLTKSSNYLCKIRNILLPKLISGELRIRDAEQMIEEIGI